MAHYALHEILVVLKEIADGMGFQFRDERDSTLPARRPGRLRAYFELPNRADTLPVIVFDVGPHPWGWRDCYLLDVHGAPMLSWSLPVGAAKESDHPLNPTFIQTLHVIQTYPLWRQILKDQVEQFLRGMEWKEGGDPWEVLDKVTFDFWSLFNAGSLGFVAAHLAMREQLAWRAQEAGRLSLDAAAASSAALILLHQQWGRHPEARRRLAELLARINCGYDSLHTQLSATTAESIRGVYHRLETAELDVKALGDAIDYVAPGRNQVKFVWRIGVAAILAGRDDEATTQFETFKETMTTHAANGPQARTAIELRHRDVIVHFVEAMRAIADCRGDDAVSHAAAARDCEEQLFRGKNYAIAQGMLSTMYLEGYSRYRFGTREEKREAEAFLGTLSKFVHRNAVGLRSDGISDVDAFLKVYDPQFPRLHGGGYVSFCKNVLTIEDLCFQLDICGGRNGEY